MNYTHSGASRGLGVAGIAAAQPQRATARRTQLLGELHVAERGAGSRTRDDILADPELLLQRSPANCVGRQADPVLKKKRRNSNG